MRKLLVFGLALVIALTTAACGGEGEQPQQEQWGVTFAAEEAAPTGMKLVVTHGGDRGQVEYGSPFHLESWDGAQWVDVPAANEVGWTDELYTVFPGEMREHEVGWSYLYGQLPPGKYRLVKRILVYEDEEHYQIRDYDAEFELT